jgi:hypothetical protein
VPPRWQHAILLPARQHIQKSPGGLSALCPLNLHWEGTLETAAHTRPDYLTLFTDKTVTGLLANAATAL